MHTPIRGMVVVAAVCTGLVSGMTMAAGTMPEAIAAYERGEFGAAFTAFLPHARNGDPVAQNHVGLMLSTGKGTRRDDAAAPGIVTVGELELLDFVKQHVDKGTGLLIDARTPEWFNKGTIPASVNIPFTTFSKQPNDPELLAALEKLGVKPKTPTLMERLIHFVKGLFGRPVNDNALNWDFRNAKQVLLWCNGPWCDQSPRAIKGLLKIGYPAEKMRYYRGGMQLWMILGLTVVVPGAELGPAPAPVKP
jgi:rhodanese-related sulfurtransferase